MSRGAMLAWLLAPSLAATLAAAAALPADLPEPPADLYQGRRVVSRIGPAPSGKIVTLIDGNVQPIYFAALAGLGDETVAYRRAGFNAIHLELTYDRKTPWADFFRAWDQSLLAIKQAGLYAMIYIHNSIHGSDGAGQGPWTFDDHWRAAVHAIVGRYRHVPNLIAWTYSDEHADGITFPTEGFRRFLEEEYGTVEALNASWRSGYRSLAEIGLEYQRDGYGRPEPGMASAWAPYGIGPKAFDSARYKLFRVRQCCQEFERAVREVDPDTPIYSPGNNLAWPVTQVPSTWLVTFDFYPGNSGHDMDTHHVWMVDIGRGPNIRPAMQFLLPERWDDPKWHLDARVLRGWMVESAIHGATGISFWPWSFLGRDQRDGDRSTPAQRIEVVGQTIRQLEESGIFAMLPRPTIGVLYQPYAEGWGAMSQVYGVLRQPSGEPIALFEELKYGTRFGQVDYLTADFLDLVGPADLDRYGVLLAPFAADMTPQRVTKLDGYVRRGGVLLADVGFGCIQGGKVVTGMAPQAMELFGIGSLRASEAAPGPFMANGSFGELLGGITNGDSTGVLRQLPLDVEPTTAQVALQGPGGQGLYVNRVGEGYALFCSALAWAEPTVRDPLLRRIHSALFARRARIARLAPDDYTAVGDQPYYACEGYEIARFGDGYAVQNRTDREMALDVVVEGKPATHALGPREALLVREGRPIPLGTGLWKVETGPAAK